MTVLVLPRVQDPHIWLSQTHHLKTVTPYDYCKALAPILAFVLPFLYFSYCTSESAPQYLPLPYRSKHSYSL